MFNSIVDRHASLRPMSISASHVKVRKSTASNLGLLVVSLHLQKLKINFLRNILTIKISIQTNPKKNTTKIFKQIDMLKILLNVLITKI